MSGCACVCALRFRGGQGECAKGGSLTWACVTVSTWRALSGCNSMACCVCVHVPGGGELIGVCVCQVVVGCCSWMRTFPAHACLGDGCNAAAYVAPR